MVITKHIIGKKSGLINRILLWMFLLVLLPPVITYAYQGTQHHDITEIAIDNYQNWVSSDEPNRVGATAIGTYEADVLWGSVHEDDGANWRYHFWNPDGGFNDGWLGYDSAYERASEFYNGGSTVHSTDEPNTLTPYADADYTEAYRTLGRVLHLIEDMGVPAHVLLDRHWPDSDWYESTYISPTDPNNYPMESGLENGASLLNIMYHLAEDSDDFDSNDEDAEVTAGAYRPAPFTNDEGVTIANTCFRGAIRSAGGFLIHFYSEVKPTIVSWDEPSSQEVYSGINGVPLDTEALSYRDDSSHDNDNISNVKFWYNTNDDESGTWLDAATLSSRDPNSEHFEGSWTNSINDSKVWIRLEANDSGDCESITQKIWIKIDSTRPTVTNTKVTGPGS